MTLNMTCSFFFTGGAGGAGAGGARRQGEPKI